MSTVASRTFKSTPHRDAAETWSEIVDLLTQGKAGNARAELLSVAGVAASVIADQAPKNAAITVTCDGPRTRIYCIYDDEAVDGSDANEGALGFDPLKGDWLVSLPCLADDLAWVQSALKKYSTRITARESNEAVTSTNEATTKSAALEFNPKGFLGS
jgi:hypothetical protein